MVTRKENICDFKNKKYHVYNFCKKLKFSYYKSRFNPMQWFWMCGPQTSTISITGGTWKIQIYWIRISGYETQHSVFSKPFPWFQAHQSLKITASLEWISGPSEELMDELKFHSTLSHQFVLFKMNGLSTVFSFTHLYHKYLLRSILIQKLRGSISWPS